MFLIFNFYFVVVYLIYFYMWLRVLRSRKVAIYYNYYCWVFGLRFKLVMLVLRWLCWYFVGFVGISLVVFPSLNVYGK